MKKDLLLIDGHGLAFRGFYALPPELSAADGAANPYLINDGGLYVEGKLLGVVTEKSDGSY